MKGACAYHPYKARELGLHSLFPGVQRPTEVRIRAASGLPGGRVGVVGLQGRMRARGCCRRRDDHPCTRSRLLACEHERFDVGIWMLGLSGKGPVVDLAVGILWSRLLVILKSAPRSSMVTFGRILLRRTLWIPLRGSRARIPCIR